MANTLNVFLNPTANRGTSSNSWSKIEPGLEKWGWTTNLIKPSGRADLQEKAIQLLLKGERFLAAAGGDGTIQALLDAVMLASEKISLSNKMIGAIGIGTSNDFHKPFSPERKIGGFPCRLNADESGLHDVIRLEVTTPDSGKLVHHLIQSSHLGTIPSANFKLTQGGGFFGLLYRTWYKFGLMAVSAWEVFTYPGFKGKVSCGKDTWEGTFSGMSLLKRKHVAGNFVFKTTRNFGDGLFDLALCDKVSSFKLISLIDKFEKEGMNGIPEVHFREAKEVSATFSDPQPIDFDGEIVVATSANWKIIPQAIKIMG